DIEVALTTPANLYSPQNVLKITGPTLPFSVSGFANGAVGGWAVGRQLEIYNASGQVMTIKNLAGSAPDFQIDTLTGADLVGVNYVSFVYDVFPGAKKWIVRTAR